MGGLVIIASNAAISSGAATAAATVASLGLGIGALVVLSVASNLAHAWLQQEQSRSESLKLEYEKQRHEFNEQQNYQSVNTSLQLTSALEKLQLSNPSQQIGHAITGIGFLKNNQQQKQLNDINDALNSLPVSWRQTYHHAWNDLQKQLINQQQHPNPTIIASLHKTLQATLKQALTEEQRYQQLRNDAQVLINEVTKLQLIAPHQLKNNYQILINEIQESLNHPERLTQINTWHHQKKQLQLQTQQLQEQLAVRYALIERIKLHLANKNYQYLGKGRFRLPVGEQVQIQFDNNGHMKMQLLHERIQNTNAALSNDEYAFFQQQEKLWHQDLNELMSQLVVDGFPLAITHHENLNAAAVPLIFFDRADQWHQQTSTAKQSLYKNQL